MKTKKGLKILLIEDDDSHTKIISRHLNHSEEETVLLTRANSLTQGLQFLSNEQFDAVLLDLRLPDSEINQTLNQVFDQFPQTPIVILSSIEDKNLARQMVHEGAQDYLCKADLSSELLLRTIYSAIERKQNALSLQESESRKAKIIEASLNCIITIDEGGNVIEFNSAAEKTFGYNRNEIIGKEMAEFIIPTRMRERHRKGLFNFLRTGDGPVLGKRIEMLALRKDGTEFPAEISIAPLKLSNQYIFTSFLRDITDQKRYADDLRSAKEAAESANHAKSAFLANMSHEIRTPLGAVLGFSELLIDPLISQADKINFIASIKRNGDLLSKIINDILDLSKVEAGKLEIEISNADLSEILADIKTFLELQALDKGISLNFHQNIPLPNNLKTDSLRLRQILLNIIGNAIKFTDRGQVDVHIDVLSTDSQGPRLAFIVTDSGKGISKEETKYLFAPFSQVDMTSKRKYGGTGLGLILSKRLANLLGGDVTLSASTPGKGSTFTITIDLGQNYMSQSKLTPNKKTDQDFYTHLNGIKILLVDDSNDNLFLVNTMLRMVGADVEVAANGIEAVTKALQKQYDVLLMDLQMPIMDGYEATATLRKQGYKTPIIALTAHALIEEKQRCLASGFDDHISKPIDRTILITKIARFSGMH